MRASLVTDIRSEAATAGFLVSSAHPATSWTCLVERLCDRIGIIDAGFIRAVGSVNELRAEASARYLVHVPGAAPGWAALVPGVTVLSELSDGRTVFSVAEDADDQKKLLAAALNAGPVREFARQQVPLAELFREVVTL